MKYSDLLDSGAMPTEMQAYFVNSELGEDLAFPSPSAAAVFVLGGSQNGWTEWVNGAGQTLDYVYRSERG